MTKRITKKLRKRSVIIMDINAIPDDMHLEDWYKMITDYGFIFWNSRHSMHKPSIVPKIHNKVFSIINKNN